jgi:hypothetical protein
VSCLPLLTAFPSVNQARRYARRYTAASLGEAVRIMPFAIRVVGIDEATLAQETAAGGSPWPNRPPLRLEGSALRDSGAVPRRVRGRVCMTGDRHVRWTLVRASAPCSH